LRAAEKPIAAGFWEGHDFSRAATPLKCACALAPEVCFLFAQSSLAALALALLLSTYALADGGADTYKTKCSAGHAANGAGDTMLGKKLQIRALASADVQKQFDDKLATIIGKGKNRMPPFDRKLSKDQIGDVVKYIRSLKK
jgi:mono/diheme cytochrome c family protein